MAVRPPRRSERIQKDPLTAAIEHEALEEKAATLSRLTRKLEEALAALGDAGEAERERLLARAGEALWHVIIQRELCGLRRHDALMRELAVPGAVRARMGPDPG